MTKTKLDKEIQIAKQKKESIIVCNQCAKVLSRRDKYQNPIMVAIPPHDCEKKAWWRRLLKHLSGL